MLIHFISRLLRAVVGILVLGTVACSPAHFDEQALHHMRPGDSYHSLLARVGPPHRQTALVRWLYADSTEVWMVDSAVVDFFLSPLPAGQKQRLVARQASVVPAGGLKIGMLESEVLQRMGPPTHKQPASLYHYRKHQRLLVVDGYIQRIDLRAYATLAQFDRIRLHFTDATLHFFNIALAVIMFGIALELRLGQFRDLLRRPKSLFVGLFAQFVALPALTYLLILVLQPTPSVAMGMLLVAACPGGNISNFMSSLSRANLALSIGLTTVSTVVSVVFTPLNFSLWGNLYAGTAAGVVPISIDLWQMLQTVLLILGLPIALGLWVGHTWPGITQRVNYYIKRFGVVFFLFVISLAFWANRQFFLDYIHLVVLIVLAHNTVALFAGFSLGSVFRVPRADRRTITIETGIQNSGLALVLIFNPKLFDGLGGMAFIAAWWGIWHMVSGMALAAFWHNRIISALTSPSAQKK